MPALENPRHEAFCQAYVRGKTAGNATASYQKAYGKPDRKGGSRCLHRDDICQRIAELQARADAIIVKADDQLAGKVALTREWIIERLVENADRAMQATAVIGNNGEPTGEYKYDGAVANKALELLGKELGMFVERSEQTSVHYEISDTPLTAEEWIAECNAAPKVN